MKRTVTLAWWWSLSNQKKMLYEYSKNKISSNRLSVVPLEVRDLDWGEELSEIGILEGNFLLSLLSFVFEGFVFVWMGDEIVLGLVLICDDDDDDENCFVFTFETEMGFFVLPLKLSDENLFLLCDCCSILSIIFSGSISSGENYE